MKVTKGIKARMCLNRLARLSAALLLALVMSGLCQTAFAETGLAHYLLLGVDGWGTNESGEARSDAIMLASLDYGGDRIIITGVFGCTSASGRFGDTVTLLDSLK